MCSCCYLYLLPAMGIFTLQPQDPTLQGGSTGPRKDTQVCLQLSGWNQRTDLTHLKHAFCAVPRSYTDSSLINVSLSSWAPDSSRVRSKSVLFTDLIQCLCSQHLPQSRGLMVAGFLNDQSDPCKIDIGNICLLVNYLGGGGGSTMWLNSFIFQSSGLKYTSGV